MSRPQILIIEDEPSMRSLLERIFTSESYDVRSASDSQSARQTLSEKTDLIILDLILPDGDGLDLLKQIRSQDGLHSVPVLLLTAKDSPTDEVAGLELGADDYVSKPFDRGVLLTRVKKLLQKNKDPLTENEIAREGLVVNPLKKKVLIEGSEVFLSAREFSILHCLASNPGRVFSRSQLINSAWEDEVKIESRAVDVHINNLRKKLGNFQHYIETVRGSGYRFRE